MDRDIYKRNILQELSGHKNLKIVEGSVRDLSIDPMNTCKGILLENGDEIVSDSVVITTGTFLGGVCHIGKQRF
jgi:tRNA uridine 5-carboxymethylaminomethyl modification enzyme